MPRVFLIAFGLLACGCGSRAASTAPTTPANDTMVITSVSPASGSTVLVPEKYPYIVPGGVVLLPDSGLMSVTLTITSARDIPWAQLNVYLLTSSTGRDYCGQNLPDSPTWTSLPAGWTTTYTVTGFQVYRLPCDVTGIRAMLHRRNSGALIPPAPGETIAEATFATSYQIRR